MKVTIITSDDREHRKDYSFPEPYFGTAPEALLQGFTQLPDVEVHVLSCVRNPVPSPEKIAPNIFYHSVLVPKIGWMTTGYQGCIRAIRKKLQEIRPDVVHGQGTERDCAICAVMSGYPNVLTIHGNMRAITKLNKDRVFSYNWLNAYLERFTIPLSAGVVCITHYTREAVKDLALQTWVVPNAVDGAFFGIERQEVNEMVLLCVGHICYLKNQIGLIHSLENLSGKKNFKLVFAGGTSPGNPYSDEFMAAVKSRSWCEYVGLADRNELKRRLAAAGMLILASLEDNCPMVVLEAMAAGVPVLAPSVGGVPDLIQNGENGLLCDPQVPATIEYAVARLLEDSPLATRLGRAGKLTALERYQPAKIAQRHLEIYAEVLSKSS